MAVNIVRTETIDSPVLNREIIANLLQNAVISGVTAADMTSNVAFISADSTPPASPSQGMWWWDTGEQLMKVYDSVHACWLAIGPDRRDMAVQNWTGDTLFKGAGVSLVPGGGGLKVQAHTPVTDGSVSANMIGTMADTTASGAWGPMSYLGIVWLRDDENGVYPVTPGDYIRQVSTISPGKFNHPNQTGDPMAGTMVVSIERAASGNLYRGLWIDYKRATPS